MPIKVAPKKTTEHGSNKSTTSIIAKLMGTDKEKVKKPLIDNKMSRRRSRRRRSPSKKKENGDKA